MKTKSTTTLHIRYRLNRQIFVIGLLVIVLISLMQQQVIDFQISNIHIITDNHTSSGFTNSIFTDNIIVLNKQEILSQEPIVDRTKIIMPNGGTFDFPETFDVHRSVTKYDPYNQRDLIVLSQDQGDLIYVFDTVTTKFTAYLSGLYPSLCGGILLQSLDGIWAVTLTNSICNVMTGEEVTLEFQPIRLFSSPSNRYVIAYTQGDYQSHAYMVLIDTQLGTIGEGYYGRFNSWLSDDIYLTSGGSLIHSVQFSMTAHYTEDNSSAGTSRGITSSNWNPETGDITSISWSISPDMGSCHLEIYNVYERKYDIITTYDNDECTPTIYGNLYDEFAYYRENNDAESIIYRRHTQTNSREDIFQGEVEDILWISDDAQYGVFLLDDNDRLELYPNWGWVRGGDKTPSHFRPQIAFIDLETDKIIYSQDTQYHGRYNGYLPCYRNLGEGLHTIEDCHYDNPGKILFDIKPSSVDRYLLPESVFDALGNGWLALADSHNRDCQRLVSLYHYQTERQIPMIWDTICGLTVQHLRDDIFEVTIDGDTILDGQTIYTIRALDVNEPPGLFADNVEVLDSEYIPPEYTVDTPTIDRITHSVIVPDVGTFPLPEEANNTTSANWVYHPDFTYHVINIILAETQSTLLFDPYAEEFIFDADGMYENICGDLSIRLLSSLWVISDHELCQPLTGKRIPIPDSNDDYHYNFKYSSPTGRYVALDEITPNSYRSSTKILDTLTEQIVYTLDYVPQRNHSRPVWITDNIYITQSSVQGTCGGCDFELTVHYLEGNSKKIFRNDNRPPRLNLETGEIQNIIQTNDRLDCKVEVYNIYSVKHEIFDRHTRCNPIYGDIYDEFGYFVDDGTLVHYNYRTQIARDVFRVGYGKRIEDVLWVSVDMKYGALVIQDTTIYAPVLPNESRSYLTLYNFMSGEIYRTQKVFFNNTTRGYGRLCAGSYTPQLYVFNNCELSPNTILFVLNDNFTMRYTIPDRVQHAVGGGWITTTTAFQFTDSKFCLHGLNLLKYDEQYHVPLIHNTLCHVEVKYIQDNIFQVIVPGKSIGEGKTVYTVKVN